MDARFFRLLAGVLMLIAVGCGESASVQPLSPTPPASAPPASPRVTVSGTVWIHDVNGVRQDANSRMFGWVQQATSGGTTGRVPTDSSGRFSFTVPVGAQVRLQGSLTNAYQPCQVVVRADTDVAHDIHLVTDRQQLGAHLPAELLAHTPVISGMVFEVDNNGQRTPLADVYVELDGLHGLGWVAATTLTDADGRYVLCGLADEPSTFVFAGKTGYRPFESNVTLAGNTSLDIELRR